MSQLMPPPSSSPAPAAPLKGGLRWQRERDRSERATLLRARGRQGVIFVLLALALLTLTLRVAYWQVAQHAALAARADAEHLRAFSVDAGRGAILDASGHVLALSVTEDTVIADPDVIREQNAMDATAATLGQLLGLPSALLRAELDVPGAYVQVRDADGKTLRLSQAQSDAVRAAIGNGDLVGVALIPSAQRVYPDGALAAQVLGFVRASDGLGQYGVEQAYQSTLAGKPGQLYTAVDANGNPLATAPQRLVPAVPGATVTLTLDANVQYWVEQGLAQAVAQTGAEGGTVIVLDPHTGAIIGMASLPSFDPNSYSASPLSSFTNPAVSGAYDPGSVMKAVTMAAGIDTGVITPDSTFDDTGVAVVDDVPLHNWDKRAHGIETMTQVLQYSANVGAIWVAQRVGRDRLNGYISAFGFGQPTGVDLPDESAGILAQPGSAGEAELAMAENAFGESIGVTPLQMVAAYGALANGGVLMRPYIVHSVSADGGQGPVTRYGPQTVRQVVSAETARTVTQMLVDSAAVSEAEMNLVQGYTVAAKTGTSTPDTRDPSKTFASVVGYAPASNPRFVLLVKLDRPQSTIFGGSAAGPLWRQLARQLFVYYQVPPDAQRSDTGQSPG
jgi:cell division protein FtsI/penicillin-binding protein 2